MELSRRTGSIEVDGITVEDAIIKAMKSLRVSRGALHVRILCEEKRGLFGMEGAKLAKIRVSIKSNLKNT